MVNCAFHNSLGFRTHILAPRCWRLSLTPKLSSAQFGVVERASRKRIAPLCKVQSISFWESVFKPTFFQSMSRAIVLAFFLSSLTIQSAPAQERNAVSRFPQPEAKSTAEDLKSKITEKIKLFGEILLDIQNGYVEPVDLDQLSETAFQAMLQSLDPYTEFENPKAATELATTTFGNYAGVGLEIAKGKDVKGQDAPFITVMKAYEGFAYDSGIRVGDRITEICQETGVCQSTKSLSTSDASDLLKGQPNSKVTLKFERSGLSGLQSKTLTRQIVLLRDVPVATQLGNPSEGVAYVKVSGFSDNAPIEVAYVLTRLQASNPLSAVVLDLRGNPGGLLTSAVKTSDLFLPEGLPVVTTKGRIMETGGAEGKIAPKSFEKTYISKPFYYQPLSEDVKMIVLVNEGTASAAEIVSGALQDHDRAVIMGRKTYGKGLVQQLDRLSGGTVLKYTSGKYYTPSGRCIQSKVYRGAGPGQLGTTSKEIEESERKVFMTDSGRPVRDAGGIEPDVVLSSAKARDAGQLRRKLEQNQAFFLFADEWQKTHFKDGKDLVESTPNLVDDQVYKSFQDWVQVKNKFDLEGVFDKPLELMIQALKETGYEEAVPEVGKLKNELQELLLKEFDSDKKEIQRTLETAIRLRFQPESEVVAWDVRRDDEVASALELARSTPRYLSIIQGPKRQAEALALSKTVGLSPATVHVDSVGFDREK